MRFIDRRFAELLRVSCLGVCRFPARFVYLSLLLSAFGVSALLPLPFLQAQEFANPARIVQPVDEGQMVTLGGHVHPLANAANDRGLAPDEMPLDRMRLFLKRSNAQESNLRQLIDDMHTPGTASYHKWLTPEQFGRQFGASDQDIATITVWLADHGFAVTQISPSRQTIEFSGTPAQLRRAFHTQVHKYSVNGEMHYAAASNPQIPAALAPVIGGFVSLNNFPLKSASHILGKASYDPKTHQATPEWTISGTPYPSFVLAPQDFAVQYDLNPLYTASTPVNGNGQTIAIVNDANVDVTLVNSFRSLFGLPVNPPQVIIDGIDPGVPGENFDSVEAYTDVEWSGAVAPNATIDLVIAANTALAQGLNLATQRAVDSNIAPIISLSFGTCESSYGNTNVWQNALWEQAAAQGITVLVSTGDSGSAGCDNEQLEQYASQGLAVNGMASTPYNIAVGGTDFYYSDYLTPSAFNTQLATYWNQTPSDNTPTVSIKQVIPEQPWNSSQYGLTISAAETSGGTSIAGGSGGASSCALATYDSTGGTVSCTGGYPKPSWQSAVGVPGDGVRDLPDLSLFAASGPNLSFYPICADPGDCQPVSSGGDVQFSGFGGTSISTPAFAGMMALVDQIYGRQGQANYVLYPLSQQYPASFHDVTVGNNSVPCEILPTPSPNCIAVTDPLVVGSVTEGQMGTGSTPAYNAGVGYDLATGLGTIDANQMVSNWNKVSFAATTTTLNASSTSFTHGSAITISGTVTGAGGIPTGTVALMTDSNEPLQQGQTTFALSGGSYSASVNTLPGGTYNIWAQYSGANNGAGKTDAASTSAKTQITVSSEASSVLLNAVQIGLGSPSMLIPNPSTNIAYGTIFTLSAVPAPTSKLSAEETCLLSDLPIGNFNANCPAFTPATGTVVFSDNGTPIGTAILNSEGEASFTPVFPFSGGSHSITAAYSGDNSYEAGTATAPFNFSVKPATTAIAVVTPANEILQGSSSTLTVLVTGFTSGPAPSGTITLSGAPAGVPTSATLSAITDLARDSDGVATVTIPSTATAGTYTITATYTPDSTSAASFPTATSSALRLLIDPPFGHSPVAMTATASPSNVFAVPTLVTVSGTVTAPSGPAPTGNVQFIVPGIVPTPSPVGSDGSIGATPLVPGSGSSSTYTFTVPSGDLPQGLTEMTVFYGADINYAFSAAILNLTKLGSATDFTLAPQTSLLSVKAGGQNTESIFVGTASGSTTTTVNFNCSAPTGITCTLPNAAIPASDQTSSTLTVNAASNVASGNYSLLVTGTDSSGTNIHTLGITIQVSTTIVAVPNVVGVTQSAATTAITGAGLSVGTVTTASSSTVASGSVISESPVAGTKVSSSSAVNLVVSSGPLSATVTLNNLSQTYSGSPLAATVTTVPSGLTVALTYNGSSTMPIAAGSYTVVATVNDPAYVGTATGTLVIAKAATTATLTAGSSSITPLQSATLTATVASTAGGTPTGIVTFFDGASQLGTGTLSAGVATYTAASLAPGLTHTLTATYAGDIDFTSSNAATAASVTVAPLDFTMNVSVPPNATVVPGGSITFQITVAPDYGAYAGQVTFAASGLPPGATATFSPASIAPNGGPQTVTVTIATAPAIAIVRPMPSLTTGIAPATLALLLLPLLGARRIRKLGGRFHGLLGLLVLLAGIAGSAALTGCGGSNGFKGQPVQNYTVTITATAGGVQHSASVSFQVQ